MNRITKTILTIALLFCFFVIAGQCHADGPPPPPPGGGHGGGGNAPPGGGAPIGEGVVMLVFMAVGLGLWKVVKLKRKYGVAMVFTT